MNEFRVSNFHEFHEVLTRYKKDTRWIFRGQSDPSWKLIPKAGRVDFNHRDDESIFIPWKRRAYSFIDNIPEDNWDWLTLAQHFGLATRLLDWTYNPLVACYFAVKNSINKDSVVYSYLNEVEIIQDKHDPFKVDGVFAFRPKGIASRVTNQSSLFTIHGPASLDLSENLSSDSNLEKIIIDKDYKKELVFELSFYGFNELTMFPDLDGLSSFVNWHVKSREYWSGSSEDTT